MPNTFSISDLDHMDVTKPVERNQMRMILSEGLSVDPQVTDWFLQRLAEDEMALRVIQRQLDQYEQ